MNSSLLQRTTKQHLIEEDEARASSTSAVRPSWPLFKFRRDYTPEDYETEMRMIEEAYARQTV